MPISGILFWSNEEQSSKPARASVCFRLPLLTVRAYWCLQETLPSDCLEPAAKLLGPAGRKSVSSPLAWGGGELVTRWLLSGFQVLRSVEEGSR